MIGLVGEPSITAMQLGGRESVSFEEIRRSASALQDWVEGQEYRGYEPFDGLSSWLRPLTCKSLMGDRLLQQLIRQFPLNLRPLLGVKPKDSTKGRGYMVSGYMLRYQLTKQQEYLDKAIECLKWLDKHKVERFPHHSWSNHFSFASRSGRYTHNDPIIVWTALIGHAYLDAFEVTRDEWLLRVADSACKWILELPRERTATGDCISYMAHLQSSIHNANMLGGGILARIAKHTGSEECRRVARQAMEYSCSRQQADGSWWYAETPEHHWIDNFHTGYNLDGLKHYADATGDRSYVSHFKKGLAYYKHNFFEQNGRPKYYHSRAYPIDIQCAAQAIDTLAFVSDEDPESLSLSRHVAAWTIHHMQDRRGYFYYRRYPLMTARTPMLHWGQATMFKALAHLLLRMGAAKPSRLV
jgi:rhamnogalacturonyl hydrolase YesR